MRYFFQIFLSFLILCCSAQVSATITTPERTALIDLYNSTNGANWKIKTNWLGGVGTECTWYGVSCDSQETRVLGISLPNNQLSGGLTAALPFGLTTLILNNNQLTGSIPVLPSGLQTLNLGSNQFSGSIPASLPSTLTTLSLYNNQLTGSIPSTLPSNLQSLDLGQNQLSGPIPTGQLTALPSSLTFLILSNNQLTGSIPSDLPFNLTFLRLDNNQLTGSIPFLSRSLTVLSLKGNQLTGNIPSLSTPLPPLLTYLDLSNNQLNGTIPALPTDLTVLNLRQNQLSGSIPTPLPSGLTFLDFDSNQLTGTIPALPTDLTTLDLGSNQLSGAIPTPLPTALETFILEFNQLTGSIPALPSTLVTLGLSGNQLSGAIPSPLPSGLTFLGLDNNQLNGSIPGPWPLNLTNIRIDNNQLTGSIPDPLPLNLTSFTASNNQLTGSIPAFLPTGLTALNLFHNQLSGTIPVLLPSGLTLLRLDSNQLSGAIPTTLAQLTGISTLKLELNNCLYTADTVLINYLNVKTPGWLLQNNCLAPTANFTTTPSQGNRPLVVNLDAATSIDNYAGFQSYTWSTSDGQSATGRQVSLTFSTLGNIDITLSVRNYNSANNSAAITKQITVLEPPPPVVTPPIISLDPPNASFSLSASQGAVPLRVNLDASSSSAGTSGIRSYDWSTSDGQTASGVQASLTFKKVGEVTITLTVTDLNYLSTKISKQITITPKPPFSLSTGASSGPVQAPATILLDASSLGIDDINAQYLWLIELQSTTQAKAKLFAKAVTTYQASGKTTSITLTDPGKYTISLTATDSQGNVFSSSQSLDVAGTPVVTTAPPGLASGSFVEPNDTPQLATPILVNDTPLQHLLNNDNVDWYEFFAKSGLNYTIEIPSDGVGNAINPALQLFDSNNNPLTDLFTQSATTKGIRVTGKASYTGIYRIKVTNIPPFSRANLFVDSAYKLRVFLTDAPQQAIVKGKVLESCSRNGINQAEIKALLNASVVDSTFSYKTGEFGLLLNPSSYQIESSANNFLGYGIAVNLNQTNESNVDFYLTPASKCSTSAPVELDLVTQEQNAVAVYDLNTGVLVVRDVLAGGDAFYVELQNIGNYRFQILRGLPIPGAIHDQPGIYNPATLLVNLPKVFALGKTWKVAFKNQDGIFVLENAE